MIKSKLTQRCCNVDTISAAAASISTLVLIIRSHQLSARDATLKRRLSRWWHLLQTEPSAKSCSMLRVSLAAGSTQAVFVKMQPKVETLLLRDLMMNEACVLCCNVGISPFYKVVSVSRLREQYKLISSSLEAGLRLHCTPDSGLSLLSEASKLESSVWVTAPTHLNSANINIIISLPSSNNTTQWLITIINIINMSKVLKGDSLVYHDFTKKTEAFQSLLIIIY